LQTALHYENQIGAIKKANIQAIAAPAFPTTPKTCSTNPKQHHRRFVPKADKRHIMT